MGGGFTMRERLCRSRGGASTRLSRETCLMKVDVCW